MPPVNKSKRIALIADATYFGKEYGFLCFSDGKRIIYSVEIENENKEIFSQSLVKIKQAGYILSCVVIDGRIGIADAIHHILPRLPIQMCHFHMKRIVHRHISNKPKGIIATELYDLMEQITFVDPQKFINKFYEIRLRHLLIKQQYGGYTGFDKCVSVIESIEKHLPYLFTFKEYKHEDIPNTTNFLEGAFSHIKEKINLHRGLKLKRKKNAIRFLLKNTPKQPK